MNTKRRAELVGGAAVKCRLGQTGLEHNASQT